MRSSEQPRTSRWQRQRRLALLVVGASLLGLGSNLPAQAQDAAATRTGDEIFGAYQLEARASGVQGRYELVGLLPGGTPVLDLTLPETTARFGSGPTGYGLASLAYPGALLGNFGSLMSQAGGPGEQVPPYPIKAEAFFPAGPVEADTSQGPVAQKVVTNALGVQATAVYGALDAPPVITVGGLASGARTAVEGTLAVGRSRVAMSDVRILGGLITIDSLVTDLVAVHDGTVGSTNGGTVASGVRFLGLDASLSEAGLVLAKAPAPTGPAAPAGSPLGELAGPLGELTQPVQDLLSDVLSQATPQLDDVLAEAGVHLRLVDPSAQQAESGAASRFSTGLELTFSYEGREQQALVDLVNGIPAELKPNVGPIPNPVSFLAENHITGLSLAPASVSALATPPFPALDFPLPSDLPSGPLPGTDPFDPGAPGFVTPPAPLPRSPESAPGAVEPLTDPVANVLDTALPAALVALALLAMPLFGIGSSRLADNVLAPVSTSCPIGLDKPPAPPRTP